MFYACSALTLGRNFCDHNVGESMDELLFIKYMILKIKHYNHPQKKQEW